MLKDDILKVLLENKLSKKEIARELNTSVRYINKILFKSNEKTTLVKMTKTIQLLRDQQRIEKKIKRKEIRENNASNQFYFELIKSLKKFKLPPLIKHENKEEDFEAIFQVSDLHFNEIISDLAENKYDFHIASKRLKKYTIEAIKIFKIYKVKKVLIAMTGDLLGSDRRVDEKLNQATNRSKATIIGTFLLENVIRELNKEFDIKITMISGNESRVFELGDSDIILEDNYDFVLYQMLKMIFKDNQDMFIDGNPYRKIIKIKNKNIMMLHGHNISNAHTEKDVIKIKGQVASNNNISLDYVIFGHIHQCQISDFYARSSSLSGGNAFSVNRLKLISKASQNIHLISNDTIHTFKIDLQNTDNILGYPIYDQFYLKKSETEKHKILIHKF